MTQYIDATPRLQFDYLLPNQASKHVTLNAALDRIDVLLQATCLSANLQQPPSSPDGGAVYIVADQAFGEWDGQDGKIAIWRDSAWTYLAPFTGCTAFDADTRQILVYSGTQWEALMPSSALTLESLGNGALNRLGINTGADDINRLAVKSEAILLSHSAANGTEGDCRLAINKSAPQATSGVVFQDDYSGRAEIGLLGDDALSLKVSDDGFTWHTGIALNGQNGAVSFPSGFQDPTQILKNLGVYHEFLAVPDQSSVTIDLGKDQFGSLLMVYTNHLSSGKGIIYCRAAQGPQIEAIATAGPLGLSTGSLTGATGTAGQINVSCDDNGQYFIENRTGSSRNIFAVLIAQF